MTDAWAFTRREFLHGGLMVVSTAPTIPQFITRSALAVVNPADQPSAASQSAAAADRILVMVQLSGGNDGLNTVIPYGAKEYYQARPMLAIPQREVLNLDQQKGIGLHPELVDLKRMLDEGAAAIVQGVGYPNPNRSHFASMDIWHTADPRGGKGLGWLGRALDLAAPEQGTALISIGREAPLAGQGRSTKSVAFENANLFRWSASELHPALAAEYDRLNRPGAQQPAVQTTNYHQLDFVMRTALDAQVASERIRQAVSRSPQTSFPRGPLAGQLRMVAAMIAAGLPTRVYYTFLGGFDTHANQPFQHGQRLREFASAVKAFYDELGALGQRRRVLTLAFSEFGRRVEQNASNGTDHGTAAPVFLFGDVLAPGLLGVHPSLGKLDHGDLIHNLDFRSVYATILDGWMRVSSVKVLGQAFRPAMVLNPQAVR